MTWQAIERAREAVERSCNCDDASECEYTDSVLAALSVVEEALGAAERYADELGMGRRGLLEDEEFQEEFGRNWGEAALGFALALARAREGIK